MNRKQLLKCIAFLLVLGAVFWRVQGVFGLDSRRVYDQFDGFSREAPGSLDAVYIGSSNVHAFWLPAIGWADRGIAVWSYSVDSIPPKAFPYLIREARKTQPDAVFLINIGTFRKLTPNVGIANNHRLLDYMPFSANKVSLIRELADLDGLSTMERLEYFLPVIRFHSRWDSLQSWSYGGVSNAYKSSMDTNQFLRSSADITGGFSNTDEALPVAEDMTEILNEVLDYCDQEGVRALFINVPQTTADDALKRLNGVEQMIAQRGYPVLDAMKLYGEFGLDLTTDFYNSGHTNIHGALKYTDYLGAYLVEHYGFTDKRGTPGWESWDEAAEAYTELISHWTLPFERSHEARDCDLAAPELNRPTVDGQTITLSWKPVDGAQAYEVYRKDESEAWALLGELQSGDELSWTDSGLEPATKYTYTVVPCLDSADGRVYGLFRYSGIDATTKK